MAEAVTLAHVARPLAALRAIGSSEWASTIACDSRARAMLEPHDGKYVALESIPAESFLDALRRGAPLYDAAILRRYVEADLDVIHRVRPDLVIGDFRLSLSVSARLAKVPYAAFSNAYWSPYYRPARWPVPDIPLTRRMPLALAQLLFSYARPVAFALHARPLNRVREDFGLPRLPHDVRHVYTDADFVLYADMEELYPTRCLPGNHRFIGPVVWQPMPTSAGALPARPADRPLIYVALGSSGPAELLSAIIDVLERLQVAAIVATAGRTNVESRSGDIRVMPLVAGTDAAQLSDLVICNGGSLGCFQALSAGVPVIGIPSNMDQFLNMAPIEAMGAGLALRADRFSEPAVERAIRSVLGDTRFRERARQLQRWSLRYSLGDRMKSFLADFVAA